MKTITHKPDSFYPDSRKCLRAITTDAAAFATVEHPDAEVYEAEPAMPWLGHPQ